MIGRLNINGSLFGPKTWATNYLPIVIQNVPNAPSKIWTKNKEKSDYCIFIFCIKKHQPSMPNLSIGFINNAICVCVKKKA